jgi:hypothetical protein
MEEYKIRSWQESCPDILIIFIFNKYLKNKSRIELYHGSLIQLRRCGLWTQGVWQNACLKFDLLTTLIVEFVVCGNSLLDGPFWSNANKNMEKIKYYI